MSMTITGGTKIGNDEIQRMVKDAETHANEDKTRRDEAEARNQADSVIYQTEKTLKEHGDKLNEADRKQVEDALQAAKDALKGSDIAAIKRTSEELMTASQKFAEVMYEQARQQDGPPQSGPTSPSDDVVDAEVVDDEESA